MGFIVEMLNRSGLSTMGKLAVMADLGNIKHNFSDRELFESFRLLHLANESYEETDDFGKDVFSFVANRYKDLRVQLGHKVMRDIVYEATESEEEKAKEKELEKEGEKKKKKEQAPLAKAMRSKGFSQNQTADALDVDKSTISRIKTGVRKPSFDLMQKISSRFGKGVVNQLLGQKD